jgi:alpha-tubulin suppressor-like RCC1 family protein
MGAPIKTDEEGQQTYDLGKTWIGEEYDIEEMNEKTKKMETVTLYRYHYDLIAEKFLKPAPPCWATPGKRTVLDIACGELHLLVVAREEGKEETVVYSSGQNQYGQLGHGDTQQRHELTPIKFFHGKEIVQVVAGASHSLALNTLGNAVFAWGRSDYGQLGLSFEQATPGAFESTPLQVPFPADANYASRARICEISSGPLMSMAILDNHDVYTWGFNEPGSTGHRTKNGEDVRRPKKLEIMRKYKKKDQQQTMGANAHVLNANGGGQHSMMVVKRFA